MGRAKETAGKKEVRNKQIKKRKDKEKRRLEKKELGKSSFDDMLAYVDENGQICSTPPSTENSQNVQAEDIEISIPKGGVKSKETVITGKVINFDAVKGYGFISSNKLMDSVFFHINDCSWEAKTGDKVEFETEKGHRGLKAIQIKKIE